MSRRKRNLHPEEQELWRKVIETAEPLHRATAPVLANQTPPAQKPFNRKPAENLMPETDFSTLRPGRPGPSVTFDLVPDLSSRLAAARVDMDRRKFGKMKKGRLVPDARVDLHGMTQAEAHPTLVSFVLSSHQAGRRLLLVITGKGKSGADHGPIPTRPGILRHQVPHWLSMPPLRGIVLQVTEAHQAHGGGGAIYVYLRRRKDG